MKLKVCGLTDVLQIAQLIELGVDYTGFIFYPPSPRFAEGKLNVATLPRPALAKRTGVFVNEEEIIIREKMKKYGLAAVQLCGEEDPDLCAALIKDVEVIKVVPVGGAEDVKQVQQYEGRCNYILLDTRSDKFGGSGRKFDWAVLTEDKIRQPFFLSGGIDETDFEAIAAIKHPLLYGVDINSRFEVSPGIKDIEKIKRFIKKIKQL